LYRPRYTLQNMRKEVIIGLSTILLVATPAFAAPNSDHGNAADAKNNHGQEVANEKTVNVPPVTLPTNVPVTVPPVGQENPFTTQVVAADVTITLTPSPSPVKHGNGADKRTVPAIKQVLSASVTPTQCDPKAEWKNHGEYVSCVAKTHPGGEVVAEAARSSIGKKDHPSVTPSVSPTPPISSPEEVLGFSIKPLETFLSAIGHLIQDLPFFHQHSHNH
jgi:hypothetical protein